MGIEPTWDGIRPTSVLKTVSVTRLLATPETVAIYRTDVSDSTPR